MIPLWKKSSQVFQECAREYDNWFDSSLLFEIEKAAINKLPIQPPRPSLEIGCGPGRFGKAMQIDYGIDPALAPLEFARNRGIECCVGIGETLPFLSNSFRSVYLLFTLCFLENPIHTLTECRRILKKNGLLIVGFIPGASSWGLSLQQKKKEGNRFYKYCTFYGSSEILEMLSITKFKVVSSVSSLFQPPGNLNRFEYGQSGLHPKAGFVVLAAKALTR